MKTNIFNWFYAFSAVMFFGMTGCTSEEPFGASSSEGTISFNTELYSDVAFVTRALDQETKQSLEDKLTVYIENNKGVIRKYAKKSEIPASITLPVGEYIIEGWTGDSVSASYNQKFYRGKQSFSVSSGTNAAVAFNVNIANVIIVVNTDQMESVPEDLKVKVSHTRGALDFDKTQIHSGVKGYYMMPNADKDLHYIIEFTNPDGEKFTKEGDIKDVQRAHEYTLQLAVDEIENTTGGALVQVKIIDTPVLDKKLYIYPGPAFKGQLGVENFDASQSQIVCVDEGASSEFKLRVVAYGGLNNLTMNFNSGFSGFETINGVNLRNNDSNVEAITTLSSKGISYKAEADTYVSDDSQNNPVLIHEGWFTFEKSFFESLPKIGQEYQIEITATDGQTNPISNSITIRIANEESVIEKNDIVSDAAPDPERFPLSILSNSAEITATLNIETSERYGIEYRISGSSDNFTKVYADANGLSSRASQTFTVKLTGLEAGKKYEYRAFCGDFSEQKTKTFATESHFTIPNWNMEDWCQDGKILEPSPSNNIHNYWDTGNHGSSTMSVTLTSNSEEMKSSGQYSAKLYSRFVGLGSTGTLGKFAAGNLFVGKYAGTSGTNGIIDFGQEYDNSHPSALKLMVNYRPKEVEKTYSGQSYQQKGDIDQGQIYIALTTEKITVSTADQSTLFENVINTDKVIAYGEKTFTTDYGPEGALEELIINFKYKTLLSKTVQPKYLVIVCSASKFGDYFTGGEGSTMYVDDFELQYGDLIFDNF